MKNWKKNVVAAAVLVTVCGGIYVNWLYSEAQMADSLVDTLDESKIMSPDMLVMADGDGVLEDLPVDTTMDDYFAAVRLARQEARDGAVTLLQEAMAYTGEGKDSAANGQLNLIVETALCEAQIESLVIAKGYTDCVAYIGQEGVSVAVAAPEGGLQQEDVAVIADIVMSQSQYTLPQIRVVEVQ